MDQTVLSLALIAIVVQFKQQSLKYVRILIALIQLLCAYWGNILTVTPADVDINQGL